MYNVFGYFNVDTVLRSYDCHLQDVGILKSQLARIQELEGKLQQLQRSQHDDNNHLSNQELCMDVLQENLPVSPTCMDLGSRNPEPLKVSNLQTSGKKITTQDFFIRFRDDRF